MDTFAYFEMIAARANVSGSIPVSPAKPCMLCGHLHGRGAPCNFTGADSIVGDKVSIPAGNVVVQEASTERPILHVKRKYERKHG